MKTITFLFISLAGLIFAACTSEDTIINNTVTKNPSSINIIISDQFESTTTRANYTGFPETVFETGDAIGIYAFDGSNYIINNARFVKQSNGTWLADNDVPYNEDCVYYAYFPYRATTYSPSTSGTVDDVDTKFASYISDTSNYFWQANQSTKDGFTYSNLMVAKGVVIDATDNAVTVKFIMQHKRGLALFTGNIADADYMNNKPYVLNNTGYFLMKPSEATTFVDNTETYTMKTTSGTYVKHKVNIDMSRLYLTFKANTDSQFKFSANGLSYSLDNGNTWTELAGNTNTPTVTAGNTIMWKNNTTLTPTSASGIGKFSSTGDFDVKGNIMSLYYGDEFENATSLAGKDYAFYRLFQNSTTLRNAENLVMPTTTVNRCYMDMFDGCTALTTAPELPATVLASYCYYNMFNGCTALTTVPELPAPRLINYCYAYMFRGCTALTTAPELPATTLASYCYQYMFQGCTALTTAPELPATTLASNCYQYMFQGCKALTTAPELPAPIAESSCYKGMFSGCSKLTTAPELPATDIRSSCYEEMFQNCILLTTAPVLAGTIRTSFSGSCYKSMFRGCTKLTTAPELPATTLADYCYDSMFNGCTALTTAPELPATTLANYCYKSMFYGCTALTTAPELPATTLTNYCYQYMFRGCTALTTAPELPATTLVSNCYGYMFAACSKLNYVKAAFTTTPSSSYTNYWLSGVAATGTFYKNIDASWNVTGANGVPTGWTIQTYTPTP